MYRHAPQDRNSKEDTNLKTQEKSEVKRKRILAALTVILGTVSSLAVWGKKFVRPWQYE
jgi:hypothetical protein